jgi:predicted Zn-dependent peptidase
MKNIIEKYFGKWSKSESIKRDVIIEKNRAVEKISYKENIEQNTLVYLYTFHGLSRREELALDILNHKLGESPNSILFRALREERGLAYDVYTEMDTTEGIKTYYIYTAVGEDDIWEVKEIIEDCIKRINTREIVISKRDIELMKKVIKTSIALILEDSEGLGSYVLNQKLMGKRIDAFSEDLKNLDYIEANDVYRVAEKVLKKPTIHILVNKK